MFGSYSYGSASYGSKSLISCSQPKCNFVVMEILQNLTDIGIDIEFYYNSQ
jgi:hypothetical protein